MFRLDFSRVSKHVLESGLTYLHPTLRRVSSDESQRFSFQKSLLAESTFSGSKHREGDSPGNGPVMAIVVSVLSFFL